MLAAAKSRFWNPPLSKPRIWLAISVAVLTDTAQFILGPLGWLWVDEGLDVLAMVLTCGLLGFHPLLLPTFIIEFIPLVDALPTWTACTGAVVFLKKRAQKPVEQSRVETPPPIDVTAEVTPER